MLGCVYGIVVYLNHVPLNLIECDPVPTPVIEPRRPRRHGWRSCRAHLELAAVPQVLRDPGGPERVTPDFGPNLAGFRAPANHAIDIRLARRPR